MTKAENQSSDPSAAQEFSSDAEREELFARICFARDEKPTGPLAVYRRLVRSGLASTVFKLLPKSRARMNRHHDDAFDKAFVAFLDESGPRTHYMRDVPGELVIWAAAFWRNTSVSEKWIELARYEAALFAVDSAPDDGDMSLADVHLARPLIFSRALRLEAFQHAVHELPENLDDFSEPEKRAVSLLVYRNAENDVEELELTPFFSRLVAACMSGAVLKDALAQSTREENIASDDLLLASVAAFLADLGERGVLLGGAAA
ncbi:MAG: hypothetical protein ABI183_19910 [Polyangiaceae bacterium]